MSDKNKMAHDPLADLAVMGHSTEAIERQVVITKEQNMTDQNNGINIGSSLTIADVSEMKGKFRELLNAGGEIQLCVGDLEQIDGAGLQLLVLLVKESIQRHCAIVWSGESNKLKQMANYAGLSSVLQLT